MGFVWFILFSLFYVSMPSQAVSLFLISLFMCLVFSQFLVGSSPRVPFVLFLISKLLSLLSSLFVVVRFPFLWGIQALPMACFSHVVSSRFFCLVVYLRTYFRFCLYMSLFLAKFVPSKFDHFAGDLVALPPELFFLQSFPSNEF
jgi:hypothetical protein